jgi:magnesium chelatase subunit I
MDINKIKTLKELKAAGYESKTIKEELRSNLILKIQAKEELFDSIHGYEHTVIPQLQSAILAKHNINLLGLRGQAKTKIARSLINLLDEYMPIVAGSQIHDDPLQPISKYAVDLIQEKGDATPIEWIHRDQRFFEKLATPDVTVADLIGDIDPIKAANLKLSYDNELAIHYGMIPRANRCIFVINELPDLQARIQVALFNILQEGDVQIRGFQVRLPLDMQFVFTANPEDYTNRGSIVTPLKDRIGSQIITHYPKSMEIAKTITEQEAKVDAEIKKAVHVPDFAKTLLEQIVIEARKSDYIDAKSGVSARMSISTYENLLSTAHLRMLKNGEKKGTVRLSDFQGIIPSITGKVELVYEGEQEGSENVALILLGEAIKTLFATEFTPIRKLSKEGEYGEFEALAQWFVDNPMLQISFDMNEKSYHKELNQVDPLANILDKYQPEVQDADKNFYLEFILWAMVENGRLDKRRMSDGMKFQNDLLAGL